MYALRSEGVITASARCACSGVLISPKLCIFLIAPASSGFDRSYAATWKDRRAIVVGASSPGDSLAPQFWIDAERLVVVRVRGALFGPQGSDIDVGGYERVGRAWLATRISMAIGTQRQTEEYFDWKADVALPESLFDVEQWSTAVHWAKPVKR